MRQSVITEAELQGQARGNVPVVHRIGRSSLVGVVADWRGLGLAIAAGYAQQHIHDAVARQLAHAIVALRIAIEHLVLGVAHVAEAELEIMLAGGVGDVHLGLIVLGRVVIGLGGRVFRRSVGIAEAGDARPDPPLDGIRRDNRKDAPCGWQEGVGAGRDVGPVAIIVHAGFHQKVVG